MQRQKRENCMLNKPFHALFTYIFILYLTGCSVTPETGGSIQSGDDSTRSDSYKSAVSAMKSGELNKARDLFIDVINKQPNLSDAHVNLAIIYTKNKSFSEAENSLNRALSINPNNIYALNQIAFLYRTQGNFTKAKESYLKAIDINSSYAYAHLNLGILYDLYLYDIERAIEQYKKYNALSTEKDKLVEKWIFDLERRHNKPVSNK